MDTVTSPYVARQHAPKLHQHVYLEAEFIQLTSLGVKDIEAYLERYDYVSRMRRNDGLPPVCMWRCVNEELFVTIYTYNESDWKTAGLKIESLDLSPSSQALVTTNDKPSETTPSASDPSEEQLSVAKKEQQTMEICADKLLRSYLESKLCFDTADEASRAFATLCMNMSLRDFDERLGAYDVGFTKLMRKAKALNIKESVLMRKYVEGIRPESVRAELRAELECADLKLPILRATARDMLTDNNKQYMRRKTTTSPDIAPARELLREATPTPRDQWHNAGRSDTKPVRAPTTAPANSAPYAAHLRDKGTCNGCKRVSWTPEHWKNCPGNTHKDKPSSSRPPNQHVHMISTTSVNATETASGPLMVPVRVGSHSFQAVLDTGASVSCVSRALAERLSHLTEVVYRPTDTTLSMADGSRVSTRLIGLSLTISTPRAVASAVTLSWFFHELPDAAEKLLLGMDMMRNLGLIDGNNIILPLERSPDGNEPMPEDDLDDHINHVLAEENERFSSELIATSAQTEQEALRPDSYSSEEYLKVIVPPSDIEHSIKEILRMHRDVFDANLTPGLAKLPPMPIKLLYDRVVHIPARPLKPDLRAEVEKQLADCEERGLIRNSNSPFQSPVVVARKKDGSIRVCFDYSALNAITQPHDYAMPNSHTVWHTQSGAEYYGTADLRSGFNQMLMVPDDIHYTAFVTPDRKGETITAFYGMRNTPAYFQEAMDMAMAHLIRHEGLTQYIDDSQFHGRDANEFLRRLDLYLKTCRQWGLRLKAEKCTFGAAEVNMLGCIISKEGRKVAPERVEAIRSLPPPIDKLELRMFMGKVVFFQDLIPDMHRIAAPLYDLMKKTATWSWTDTHQRAFEELKSALTSDTVLANPDGDGDLILRTDASQVGLGGVLLLRTPGAPDRPISYFSHKFSDTMTRWSTYEQELYAILYCLTRNPFRQLLKLKKFTVETDHRNLQYLSSVDADRSPKLTRWKLILLEYTFEIKHISGESNVVADCLSRYGYTNKPTSTADVHPISACFATVGAVDTVEQASEHFWRLLRDAQTQMSLEEKDGLVKDSSDVLRDADGYCYVPATASDLHKHLLKVAHGTPFAGHQGVKRCVDAIRLAGFHWKTMEDDVKGFVAECPVCQKTRLHNHGVTHMATTTGSAILQTLAVDSIGPLPTDTNGNQYILVMCDIGSRVTRLRATKSTDALTAAQAIMEEFIARLGIPRTLRTDGGTQFANQIIDALTDVLHMRHHQILPYQPQSNGIVERANGEVLRHLKCLLLDAGKTSQWSHHLPTIEFIINNSVHTALGVTPNAMLYGYLTPQRFDFPTLIAEADVAAVQGEKAKEYVRMLQDQLAFLRNTAERAQNIALAHQDKRYNTTPPTVYNPGDFVLLKRTHDQHPAKLEPLWQGPFKIIENVAPQVFSIQYLYDPTRFLTVHHMRLIPFKVRDDVSLDKLIELAEMDSGELLVEKVLGHEGFNKRNVRFHLRWLGFQPCDDTWEPWTHVDGNEKVLEYIRANPELQHLLREKRHADQPV